MPIAFPIQSCGRANSWFSLEGGTARIAGEVHVGQGQLEVAGGRLETDGVLVDGFGVPSNDSSVSQRGGIVAAAGDVKIQDGVYALSGGELNVERLLMGDPAMDSSILIGIQNSRSPEFVQTGGNLFVRQNLELCVPGFVWPLPTDPTFTDVRLSPTSRRPRRRGRHHRR